MKPFSISLLAIAVALPGAIAFSASLTPIVAPASSSTSKTANTPHPHALQSSRAMPAHQIRTAKTPILSHRPEHTTQASGFYIGLSGGAAITSFHLLPKGGETTIAGTNDHFNASRLNPHNGTVGIMLGYNFLPQFYIPIRIDLRYTYNTSGNATQHPFNDSNPGHYSSGYSDATVDFTAYQIMTDIYWDFYRNNVLDLYVGPGVGYARNRMTYTETGHHGWSSYFHEYSNNNLALSATLGANILLTPHWQIGPYLRFSYLGETTNGNWDKAFYVGDKHTIQYSLGANVLYQFPYSVI